MPSPSLFVPLARLPAASRSNVAALPSREAAGEMAAALRFILPSFSLAESERELVITACPTDASYVDVMSQPPASRSAGA